MPLCPARLLVVLLFLFLAIPCSSYVCGMSRNYFHFLETFSRQCDFRALCSPQLQDATPNQTKQNENQAEIRITGRYGMRCRHGGQPPRLSLCRGPRAKPPPAVF